MPTVRQENRIIGRNWTSARFTLVAARANNGRSRLTGNGPKGRRSRPNSWRAICIRGIGNYDDFRWCLNNEDAMVHGNRQIQLFLVKTNAFNYCRLPAGFACCICLGLLITKKSTPQSEIGLFCLNSCLGAVATTNGCVCDVTDGEAIMTQRLM